MLTFEVEGSGADACRVAESLNLFTLAPSLGGVDSLVTIPVLTSHYMIDPELREKMGVTEQMIRLSVGLEHVEDLIADLEKGLSQLVSRQPSAISFQSSVVEGLHPSSPGLLE